MKFSHQLVVSSLAVLVLSACTSSPLERRQAKDDFDYLETQPLETWTTPEGDDFHYYPNYDIPQGDFHGPVGGDVDIRPPQQILELIPGARAELNNGEVTMWLLRDSEVDKVWQTALELIKERDITLRENSETHIETDWVSWESEDEDGVIEARYAMERFEANSRYGFKISLIELREEGKEKSVSTTNRERYNVFMTNMLTSRYDQKLQEEAQRKAQQLIKHIPVMMGKDRSGLPVIIARAQYNVFWDRATELLPKMGFKIEERNRSQGMMKALYFPLDEEFLEANAVEQPSLTKGTYTLSFGDLGNRTSLMISDSSGKPKTEEALQSLVPVLDVVLKQEGNQ